MKKYEITAVKKISEINGTRFTEWFINGISINNSKKYNDYYPTFNPGDPNLRTKQKISMESIWNHENLLKVFGEIVKNDRIVWLTRDDTPSHLLDCQGSICSKEKINEVIKEIKKLKI